MDRGSQSDRKRLPRITVPQSDGSPNKEKKI